jgi:hypothetical protein
MAGERKLWERVRSRLVPFFYVQRIENMVGEGVPDVLLVCRKTGAIVLVELKSVDRLPVRVKSKVFGSGGLNPQQVAWIYGRASSGCRIWVLAGGDRGLMWLVPGAYAREFNDWGVNDLTPYAVTYDTLVLCLQQPPPLLAPSGVLDKTSEEG